MITRLFSFPGGLRLPDHTAPSTGRVLVRAPLPERLIVPLLQHRGDPCEPAVTAGERVRRGSLVGRATGETPPVHAPTSGRVLSVEPCPVPHPAGLRVPAVILEADGEDVWSEDLPPPWQDWETVSPEHLRQRVHEAGVVGLGGAGFPTATKLRAGAKPGIHTLIINGVECEPWISCDQMLMLSRPQDVIEGARILARATGATRLILALEEGRTACLDALRRAMDQGPGITLELAAVPARYPAGGERQLIQTLTGREVPSANLPPDMGFLCQNVATAAAARDAVVLGRPLTSRVVTVTGNAVAAPQNLEARIGTPMHTLIEAAGGYCGTPERLVMGGPMMGFALDSDRLPITKTSNCLLVGDGALFPAEAPAMPCIRCGACAEVCPVRLLPQELYWHARSERPEPARDLGLLDCIDCGACAVVCPSRIPLSQYFRYAKSELQATDRAHVQAEQARRRYLLRQDRLTREQQAQEERRRRKKAALRQPATNRSPDPKAARQAAIQAAVERAKRKKAGAGGDGNDPA
ncbi:MAG: electron transport complex subunit RsxC [Ectothiorhodospiraceae bacterium]|nr:electron transport complex subunit RsxC [Ectothiorhodospiraceae bacterium]